MTRFYEIKYDPDDKGRPYHLNGDYTPEEWEFQSVEPNPLDLTITQKYSLKITDRDIKKLDFDYYASEPTLVSSAFLDICKDLQVRCRTIKIDIKLASGMPVAKDYYIFLPGDSVSLLDPRDSIFTLEHVVETGEIMLDTFFPPHPIYSKIEKFVAKNINTPALFYCIETMKLVCSDDFRNRSATANLTGIEFIPMDDNYAYDFWGPA